MSNSKTKPVPYLILLTMIVALLSACDKSSSSAANAKSEPEKLPSAESAELVFKHENESWINDGTLSIDSFKKTDGQKRSVFGQDFYGLEFEAIVSFPKGPMTTYCVKYGADKGRFYMCGMPGEEVSPSGSPIKVTGTINFVKSEMGWKPQ